MTTYPISISTYSRGTDHETGKLLPYHWAFFIHTGGSVDDLDAAGIAHQLRGRPGHFRYPGPEKVESLAKSTSRVQTLKVGQVPQDQLSSVTQCLNSVTIIQKEDSSWNCQDWSLDGLNELASKGFITQGYGTEWVKRFLRER
jgi:Family of unknown function (DUF6540)